MGSDYCLPRSPKRPGIFADQTGGHAGSCLLFIAYEFRVERRLQFQMRASQPQLLITQCIGVSQRAAPVVASDEHADDVW